MYAPHYYDRQSAGDSDRIEDDPCLITRAAFRPD